MLSLDSSGEPGIGPSPAGSWNHFGHGQPPVNPSHHGNSGLSPFRSYFDPPPFSTSNSGSTYSQQVPQHSPGSFGSSNSSLTSLTDLSNSRHPSLSSTSSTSSINNSNINNSNNNSSSTVGNGGNHNTLLSGSSPSGSGSVSSGYSSMSPILPSFRNTFMTDGDSMSMLSSPSGATSPPESTSSPRSGKQVNGLADGASAQSSPSVSSLTSGYGSSSSSVGSVAGETNSSGNPTPYSSSSFHLSQSYSGAPSGGGAGGSSGLYHPHPQHPCLPPSNPFGAPSSSMLGATNSMGPYGSGGSSFGPSPAEHHHHHPHFGMSPWTPSGYSGGYSSAPSPYGGYPPPPPPPQPMNPPPTFGHMNPINQYSAYGQNHQMRESWGTPHLSPFGPNLNMHPHHHVPPAPPPSCFVTPPKPKVIPEVEESYSDNEESFKDSGMGGVAVALTHGAVLLQCAKHEMHATTSVKTPNRMYPSRICLIFYQHKSMNNRFHGWSEWEKKIEAKKLQEVKLINQGKLEASPRKMKQLIKEGYLTDNS